MSTKHAAGRTLPNSREAEEAVLSCCLLDGSETIARARSSGVTAKSFHTSANAVIFQHICTLFVRTHNVDVSVLAEEMKLDGSLEIVGGYPYLVQISSRIPTTAQAQYFIDKVLELESLRDLISLATGAVDRAFDYQGDGVAGLIAQFDNGLNSLRTRENAIELLRPLTDFNLPDEDDPSSLMGRNRYICRGDGVLIVSSAGMGKSSLSMEWAVCAALGRPFHGIETKKPLTSLVIQAEDSDGDVGEVWFSIKTSMKLTDEEMELVKQRVIVVRDKVSRGDAFISRLRILTEKIQPDLVWLNPLHAYAGCDIADATEMGRFLREGLNKANRDDRFAYMVVHHTPKPMTGKGVADKKWHEFMYDAAGSAELVNWARSVLTLKPAEKEGEFNLVLAKRGKRAGVMIEVQGEHSTFLEITTKIPLRHSSETIQIPGRAHPFYLIKWENRDPDPDTSDKKSRGTPFESVYTDGDILSYFPAGGKSKEREDDAEPYSSLARNVKMGCGMAQATFTRRLPKLVAAKLVRQLDDKRYLRTDEGDRLVTEFLKSRE